MPGEPAHGQTGPDFPDNNPVGVSIVLPCLNEAATLPSCIRKAQQAIRDLSLPGEIIVADNGSDDNSPEVAESLGARVVNVPTRGYGAALIHGIREARGRYIVMGDTDDSYDFREAVPMVKKLLEGYDLVMGTRLRGHILPGAMPWKNRYIGTPLLTGLVNRLFGSSFSDVNCGLRAFTSQAFREMRLESYGMEFASEMLVKASVLGLKTAEVPISLHPDGRNRSPHLRPWSDGLRHLKYILLFAPKFVFWVPGFTLLVLGIILAIALNAVPGGTFVYMFGFRFNDHWIVVAALLCLLGYQIILTGFLAHLYTLTHRLQRRSVPIDKLTRVITLESIALFAVVTFAAGLGLEFSVLNAWISGDFGPLNAFRPAVTGMTLILVSTQTLFNGFFYSVLLEQYSRQQSS